MKFTAYEAAGIAPFIEHSPITRPIEGLSLERELVIATVLGSTTPVEIRKIAELAARYQWQ